MSKLRNWLNAERGRAKALADHLNVSRGRIAQMAVDGVPVEHMPKVHAFSKKQVSIESMVLDRAKRKTPTEA